MTATALLLDLDGTLVDTAPQLVHAALAALTAHGITTAVADAASALATLRTYAGAGAQALLAHLSGRDPEPSWVATMLECYREQVVASQPYPGWTQVLAQYPWAVVTNKPRRFAAPLLARWWPEGVILLTPDDAAAKPDPAGVMMALKRIGVTAEYALLVGDDRRDAQAAAAAGVRFVLARYGYGGDNADAWPEPIWARIDAPQELAALLDGEA